MKNFDYDFDDEIILDDFEEINIPFPQGEPIGSLGTVIFERDENGKMKATTEFDQLSDRITRAADVLLNTRAKYDEIDQSDADFASQAIDQIGCLTSGLDNTLAILEGRE